MLGGGFLNQMRETVKQNRDMENSALGKGDRNPPAAYGNRSVRGSSVKDDESLSELERVALIARVRDADRQDALIKRIVVFGSTLIVISLAILFLYLVKAR